MIAQLIEQIGRIEMKESLAEKMKRFMIQGWVSKPAYIRALGWLLLGIIIGVLLP